MILFSKTVQYIGAGREDEPSGYTRGLWKNIKWTKIRLDWRRRYITSL